MSYTPPTPWRDRPAEYEDDAIIEGANLFDASGGDVFTEDIDGYALGLSTETASLIRAAVNFFHSEDRQTPTDKIPVGGFWPLLDTLKQLVTDYQDVPDPTDTDGQTLFEDARALLDRYGVK